jgi:sigma-B regulation protein RsbU (phosphoserine phosphatase)
MSRSRLMPRPATILVVDDSPVNLQVLVRTLDGSGHRILAATSGASALQIASRVKPDLILLDVMMPEMDGFEVCRRIKADPAISDVAIIFLSALGEVRDKVAGLELGALDYITKPIHAEEVLARVAAQLTRLQLERDVRLSRDSLDRELGAAAAMQRLILPRTFPVIGNLNFAAYYQTSRYVGGDYFDVISLPENRCGILVADVSGHGAPSAIVMAMIRAAFHAYHLPAIHPAAVLKYLNEQFRFMWGTSMLATLCYSVIDSAGSMRVACAGHPPPLLLRNANVSEISTDSTIPLLLMDIPEIPTTDHQLHPGDRILFYTDGVIERENGAGDMFEVQGVEQSLARAHHLESEELMKFLVQDVERFASGTEAHDDQTLLLVTI